MGFSYAFYLMLGVNGPLGDEYVEGFGSVKDSLATTFLIMLGEEAWGVPIVGSGWG